MSVQVENLEHNMAKLTIEVEAAEFDAACKKVYNRKKGSYNLPGFRKGKVPMNMLEKTYGPGIFYEDAANEIMPKAYADALEETKLDVVSAPEVDVTQIGKGQNFIFTVSVAVRPEVTLGEYKGLEVEKETVEVADAEVEAELKKAQEQNAREITIEDRPVKEGDIISIDIPNLKLEVKVSDEEMQARKAKWQPRQPKVTTGYLARYAAMVTSGNRGAILEIPKAE